MILENQADSLKEDQDVEDDWSILVIVEFVFQFLNGVLHGGAVTIVDLRPAGQSRFYSLI